MKAASFTIDRIVLLFAGAMVFLSVLLAATVSPKFLYFTGFVGLNLFQSALTGFCPLALILKRSGCQTGTLYR
jgi:hypothetical protein